MRTVERGAEEFADPGNREKLKHGVDAHCLSSVNTDFCLSARGSQRLLQVICCQLRAIEVGAEVFIVARILYGLKEGCDVRRLGGVDADARVGSCRADGLLEVVRSQLSAIEIGAEFLGISSDAEQL